MTHEHLINAAYDELQELAFTLVEEAISKAGSVTKLALKLRVSKSAIKYWRNGTSIPLRQNLLLLAKYVDG